MFEESGKKKKNTAWGSTKEFNSQAIKGDTKFSRLLSKSKYSINYVKDSFFLPSRETLPLIYLQGLA